MVNDDFDYNLCSTYDEALIKLMNDYIFEASQKYSDNSMNIKDSVLIRRAKKADIDDVMGIFNSISSEDQKFLAYNSKASLIRQIIRSERHCYVAVYNGTIVGFLRESGRPEGFSLLEELVVLPEYRGKGIATKLINYYHKEFNKNMAKTNAANNIMKGLLTKNGYSAENPDAPRIIYWVRNGE